MVREWSTKLRSLGVPFFGTSSDLVIPVSKEKELEGSGGVGMGKIKESDCECF
jgi:hypothetical protein